LHVISVNRTGYEADPSGVTNGIQFWGSSFVAGPQGEFLAQAPADKEENLVLDIDLSRTETVRRMWPFFRDRRIDAFGDITKRFRD
jgi:N-carbamoylputrescine amidase